MQYIVTLLLFYIYVGYTRPQGTQVQPSHVENLEQPGYTVLSLMNYYRMNLCIQGSGKHYYLYNEVDQRMFNFVKFTQSGQKNFW